MGVSGSIHPFGPSRFPIWPTELNFHNACCHWEISFARSAASPGLAERQRARIGSRSREGSVELRVFHRVERYFGDNPLSTASFWSAPARRSGDGALDSPAPLRVPAKAGSRSACAGSPRARISNVAARYLSSGKTPPKEDSLRNT